MDTERAEIEAIKCRESVEYFIDTYCIIKDPITQQELPFNLWGFQRGILGDLGQHRLMIILKARQLGISWLLCGYALWQAMFHPAANVLLVSKGEDEATELLRNRVRFMWERLPPFLKPTLSPDHSTLIGFKVMGSQIRALPATESAGRMETASVVICDEWDYHPYALQNYGALKPTIDAGGWFIGCSTVDKTKMISFFKTMYRVALKGENGFHPIFLGWNLRPGRDEEWFEQQKRDYPEFLLEQEYPSTGDEALSPPVALSYFDTDALKDMLNNTMNPIEERQNDIIKIYKKPVVAKRYVCGVDVGEGVGGDYSVAIILDWQTGETVAVMGANTVAQDLFAYELTKLCSEYNDCLLGIEKNVGQLCINKVEELGYRNLYYRDEKRLKAGWVTDKANKPVLLGELEEVVRNRGVIVWDRDTVSEMFSFIRNEGRLEAQEGAHDDRVIALAIAWRMRSEVKAVSTGKPFSLMQSKGKSYH